MMHMGFVAAKGELMPVLIKGALLARHGGADGDVVVVVCAGGLMIHMGFVAAKVGVVWDAQLREGGGADEVRGVDAAVGPA